MTPRMIAVDEITAQEDCMALLRAGSCGVTLLATVHAIDKNDLKRKPIYRSLMDHCLFENLVILRAHKSWTLERMKI